MLIIFCLIFIFKGAIINNGWASLNSKLGNKNNPFIMLFAFSAIPVFRLLVIFLIIYMSTTSYDYFCNKYNHKL